MYERQWLKHINGIGRDNQHKLRTYCLFKTKFEMEPYLQYKYQISNRRNYTKMRVSAHTLAVETGRYTQPKTPLHLRKCVFCNLDELEDEEHVVLRCPRYDTIRTELVSKLSCQNDNVCNLTDRDKFIFIMNAGNNIELCCPVLYFFNNISEIRKQYMGI